MNKIAFLALALTIAFNVFANIILKREMLAVKLSDRDLAALVVSIAKNPYVLLGIASFGIAFLFYCIALSAMDLSLVYPLMSGACFILVLLASVFLFGETINFFRFVGIVSILFGVIIISFSG